MAKKSLIIYSSQTGNTEKVALRFQKVFKQKGWECDLFKVDKNTDVKNPPVNYKDYDFLCLGSPVIFRLPTEAMINLVNAYVEKLPHRIITPGPKKGIVFATYSGAHLGPKEPMPALAYLQLQMEHLKFECIGTFACPGKMPQRPTPGFWYQNIVDRPSERDLKAAEIFIAEKIEDLHYK